MKIDDASKALSAVAGGAGMVAALLVGAPTALADPATPDPGPGPEQTVQVAVGDTAPPAAGVPHLPSPENLPPGTSMTPAGPRESSGLTYLRELWHAVQTQEVSGKDALLLLTQRPLDPNATPPPGLSANPTPPAPAAPPAAPPPPPLP